MQVSQPSTTAAQQAASFGYEIAPPDQGLCVGGGEGQMMGSWRIIMRSGGAAYRHRTLPAIPCPRPSAP
jgi:predicted Rossmann-fold nucleotide-binding protein